MAGLVLSLSCLAQAAPTLSGDATGMWYDARHPGWGLGLVQQNDSVFATLFTYDASGTAVWLVASRLQANGVNFDPCGTMSLSGALYRTQWPTFGGAANPSGTVHVDPAGTISVTVATAPQGVNGCDRNSAFVEYSIDGTRTQVMVTRLAWTSSQARLYGQFTGGFAFRAAPTCPAAPIPASGPQFAITGSADDMNPAGVRLLWGTGSDTVCEIRGTFSQGGQLGAVSGALACGPVGSELTAVGTIRLSSLYLGDAGFVGEVALDVNASRYLGTVSGARRP